MNKKELRSLRYKRLLKSFELRASADYNTGSIPAASAWLLYSVAYAFQPQFVLEIGTFIGRSTVSLALGIADSGVQGGEIHSCDWSNDIELPSLASTSIIQYPKQSSLDMLTKIAMNPGTDKKFELMHLDGRIQDDDFQTLEKITSPDVIFALDDFEGMEKGVINYMKLREFGLLNSYHLVYPPTGTLLRRFGFNTPSTTALLIPGESISYTLQ